MRLSLRYFLHESFQRTNINYYATMSKSTKRCGSPNKCKESTFIFHAGTMLKQNWSGDALGANDQRKFSSSFGTKPLICAILWNTILPSKNGVHPVHLLWTLHFLKTSSTQGVLSSTVESDEKTIRKWVWYFVGCIADLESKVVSYFFIFDFIIYACLYV